MYKNQVYNLIIAVVLFVLIILRLWGNVEEYIVASFNFIGMSIALVSVLFKLEDNARDRHKPIWFMIALIFVLVLIVLTVCIFVKVIVLTPTQNDVITLAALLFSIPADLYIAILSPKK